MTSLFLYGTLLYQPLLQLVLGPESTAKMAAARLPDHAVFWAGDHAFPLIAAAAGGRVEGLLLTDLSTGDLARLDYYEGGFAYHRQPHLVLAEDGPVQATVYFPDPGHWTPGDPWSLDLWEQRSGAMALRAAAEVMQEYGDLSAQTLARVRPQIEARAASWVRAQHEQTPQDVRQGFTADDVDIIARRQPYTRFFALEEQDLRFCTFDGAMSPVVERAAQVSGDAVTVLPYDPARDRVLLIEQFRFGPLVRGDRAPWSLEPIAGRIDASESPEATAERETLEEAGLKLHRLERIANYYTSPGANSEYLMSYLGLAELPDDIARIGGLDSEAEDIRGVLVSFDQLMTLVQTGEAQNGPLLLSAFWLAANRERLRSSA